jgi:hypothetical protein
VVKGHLTAKRAMLVTLAVSITALIVAPGAAADACVPEDGWVCGVTAPPVPPDQAGNPQPVTIEVVQNPDVPPSVGVDLGLPAPPKHATCKRRHKAHSASPKRCRKKRTSQAALLGAPAALADDDCLPENGCVPPIVVDPLPIDEAGDPQVETIEATQLAGAVPYIDVPLPLYTGPKPCKAKHRHRASHPKRCKKKRK